MIKNIVIQQSGADENFLVDGIRVKKSGYDQEDWVFVESGGYNLIKMAVGKNGEFAASQYGAWAVREVNVTQKTNGVHTDPSDEKISTKPRSLSLRVGGKSRLMNGVKRLRVHLQGGGTVDLVPETDVATMNLYVTKRGKYKAVDEGYAGFKNVIVDIAESASGYDGHIDTGDIYDADVYDGDGGWSDLPHEIRVTQLPNITTYEPGERVDYTGMVVKAYNEDGTVWTNSDYPDGIIPNSELNLKEFVEAVMTLLDYGYYPKTDMQDLSYYNLYISIQRNERTPLILTEAQNYYFAQYKSEERDEEFLEEHTIIGNDVYSVTFMRDTHRLVVLCSHNPFNVIDKVTRKYNRSGRVIENESQRNVNNYSGNPSFYYTSFSNGVLISGYRESGVDYEFSENVDTNNASMVLEHTVYTDYGIGSRAVAWGVMNGGAKLPIHWNRPRDDKELSATIKITLLRT